MANGKSRREIMRTDIWSNEEIAYLVKHYNKKKPQDIADYLGRSLDAVYQKAKEFGIRNRSENKRQYVKRLVSITPKQDEYLAQFNNRSMIVRKALALYISREKNKEKYDSKRKSS